MRQTPFAAAAMGLALLGTVVVAQAASARTRGTVSTISATQIDLKTRDGGSASFAITPDTKYVGETTGAMSDIKAGSYIGTAAVPAGNGMLRALEVTVFPPAMAGAGEGHYPWDLGKTSSMTNGTVGHLVVSNGNIMTVTYKGGEQKIMVPTDVPIVMIAPGTAASVTPGVKVIVNPPKTDPKTAEFILYGENGITPPQ
jgi:hypothetical protein